VLAWNGSDAAHDAKSLGETASFAPFGEEVNFDSRQPGRRFGSIPPPITLGSLNPRYFHPNPFLLRARYLSVVSAINSPAPSLTVVSARGSSLS
jgi:hypothetical protein